MKIKVLVFGQLKDLIKADEIWLEGLGHSDEILPQLQAQFQGIQNFQFKIAVNKKMIHQGMSLQENDVIALLPAFSGG